MADTVARSASLGAPYSSPQPQPEAPPAAPPAGVPPNLPGSAVAATSMGSGSYAGVVATTADDVFPSASASGTSPGAIEQVVRAHESLARVAARIAAQVADCIGADRHVLVQDADGGGLIAAFRAFRAQATLLERAFDAVGAPPRPAASAAGAAGRESALPRMGFAPVAAAASVAAAIKSADALVLPIKHIAGLLQSRVSGLEARLVHADEAPLVAEIARHLRASGRTVIYPRMLPLELRDPLPALELIAATLDSAQRAESLAAARVAALDAPDRTRAAAELAPLVAALARMRKQLFELPDSSTVPSDARALIEGADWVRELDRGAVLLLVQIAGAGSSPRAATAWHWKPAYSAGAVVSFFLASGSAELLRSGTVADYTTFREPRSF